MPTTVSPGIIEAKKFTVFIDISPNHLLCTDSFKRNCKVSNFKSSFEGRADVGFTNVTGNGMWFKVTKRFRMYNDHIIILY